MRPAIITDIETNGLLDTVSKFHCAWTYNTVTQEWKAWRPFQAYEYFKFLDDAMGDGLNLVFHNGIKYDIPALKILNGRFSCDPVGKVIDTLVYSRLVWANIEAQDTGLMKSGKLPGKLFGSHSLEAYGYRLGLLKGTYGKQENAWEVFTEDMLEYCKRDVEVTLKLYEKLEAKGYPKMAIDLEHQIAWVMAKQERNGFCFNENAAGELYGELAVRRSQIEDQLVETFGCWYVGKAPKTPKRDNKKLGYLEGCAFTPVERVMFNPASRAHIGKVLIDRGWKPEEYTATGLPKVDEETLSHINGIPEAKLVNEYLMIQKRIGQLAEGDNAWLKLCKKGKIHGSVNPNGAVTGRATHSYPNVAQVPSIRAPYGKQCRELFGVPQGWYQVGVDASGLELRCFGHFLFPYDGGSYIDTILNGDIHTANQLAAGLPTRDNAKTFIYGFLNSVLK